MSEDALRCIVCGSRLRNVFDDAENQPSSGTAFESEGHYGSTQFDPMDGSYIEINVCDVCLVQARKDGRVLWGRKRKMVVCEGTVVGWTRAPRPLMPWTGDELPAHADPRPAEDVLYVEREDLCNHELFPEIVWLEGARLMKDEYEADEGEA